YGFFGTFEYSNAPGGIVNGMGAGLENKDDTDFNLSYAKPGRGHDWHGRNNWLAYNSGYMLAVALHTER
ncbi:MAG: glycoside hydrolase, partial [Bacteroidota bacterium]